MSSLCLHTLTPGRVHLPNWVLTCYVRTDLVPNLDFWVFPACLVKRAISQKMRNLTSGAEGILLSLSAVTLSLLQFHLVDKAL